MIYAMESRALAKRMALMSKVQALSAQAPDPAPTAVPTYKIIDGVAHVPVQGDLADSRSWIDELFGTGPVMTYTEMADAIVAAADDEGAKEIQLDIDSYGGYVDGIYKATEAIALARIVKPVKAVVGSAATSAAYWIASQAETITADSDLSALGSIGVAAAVWKPEGMYDIASSAAPNKRPDVSTDEGKAVIQKELDDIHAIFAGAVAAGRGIDVEKVNADYGQGGIVLAGEAKKRGMIDKVRKNAAVGGTQAAGPKDKKEGHRMDMTIDQIKAEAPAMAAALRDEGIALERSRVAGLESWLGINADCDKIVAETKANGKRYEDVAAQLNAAAARGKSAPAADGENAADVTTSTAANASGAIADEVPGMTAKDVSDLKKAGMTMDEIRANAPKGAA